MKTLIASIWLAAGMYTAGHFNSTVSQERGVNIGIPTAAITTVAWPAYWGIVSVDLERGGVSDG